MAKPGSPSRASTGGGPGPTRERIVEAALATLKSAGFAGASARAIARAGGFNQALIFYHFGSVNDLLLAALEETSRRRMSAYREAIGRVAEPAAGGLLGLVEVAARVYREDLEAGHLTVLAEMVGAAVSAPDLGPRVAECLRPWVAFTEEVVGRAVSGSAADAVVPASDAAYAVVALYLGVELLTHLDGDRTRAEALFTSGARMAELFGPLLAAGSRP
jgi:AcrR family transcriptional regulator